MQQVTELIEDPWVVNLVCHTVVKEPSAVDLPVCENGKSRKKNQKVVFTLKKVVFGMSGNAKRIKNPPNTSMIPVNQEHCAADLYGEVSHTAFFIGSFPFLRL